VAQSGDNARAVQRVVIQILVLNLAVAGAKALYGYLSGSLAVASDAIHSLTDAASNVIGMFVLRMAQKSPDEDHPYGHRKMEIVGAAFIGILIAASSLRFGWSAIQALMTDAPPPRVTAAGFAVMGGSLLVNLFVALYEHRRGKQLGSAFLVADAAHTASDVWVTVAVIGSLVLTVLRVPRADPLVALGVLVVIAVVSWRILAANLGVLVDRVQLDAARVKDAAMAVVGVMGVHRVRSRGVDGAAHLDLHLQVDGGMSVRDAHGISHQVEDALRQAFPGVIDVTIHIEPDEEPEEGL
jgi:cation diffusion facilitator family transporter